MIKKAGLISLILFVAICSVGLFIGFSQIQATQAHEQIKSQPNLLSTEWENMGLYGARLDTHNGIQLDPQSEMVYACTAGTYGIYKTTNGGDLWAPLTSTLEGCHSIAFDSDANDLYRVTWGAVFHSNDGGLSWRTILSTQELPDPSEIALVAIHPLYPSHIFVGVNPGKIFMSLDGGDTWTQSLLSMDGVVYQDAIEASFNPFCSITADPTRPNVVYAGIGSFDPDKEGSGIYRSLDGGATFTRIMTDTIGLSINTGVNANGTAFASSDNQIWRSHDGGETWESVFNGGGGFSFHPTLTETLWTWGSRSDDEGDTWVHTGYAPPTVHPVYSNTMYHPTSYGLAKSVDGGQTWADINDGLEEIDVWDFTVDPHDQRRYFVLATGGIGYTDDDGDSWTFPVLAGDYRDLLIDPVNPQTVFVLGEGMPSLEKSLDGGLTWDRYHIDDGFGEGTRLNQIVLDPGDSQTGYIGIDAAGPPFTEHWGGVYKSIDGGETWISTTLRDVPVNAVLYISETNALYAGALNPWTGDPLGGLYLSEDQATTWSRIALTGTGVVKLENDPRYPSHLYAITQDNALLKSLDGGVTWDELGRSSGEMRDIALDPENLDIVYLIAGEDIHRSLDAGSTWELYDPLEPGEGQPKFLHIPWLPPTQIYSASAVISDSSHILLSWNTPDDVDFSGTYIRYHTTTFPIHYYDGMPVVDIPGEPSTSETFIHTDAFSGTTLYYSIFSYDADMHFSDPIYVSVTFGTHQVANTNPQISNVTDKAFVKQIYQGNSRGLYRQPILQTRQIFLPIVLRR